METSEHNIVRLGVFVSNTFSFDVLIGLYNPDYIKSEVVRARKLQPYGDITTEGVRNTQRYDDIKTKGVATNMKVLQQT